VAALAAVAAEFFFFFFMIFHLYARAFAQDLFRVIPGLSASTRRESFGRSSHREVVTPLGATGAAFSSWPASAPPPASSFVIAVWLFAFIGLSLQVILRMAEPRSFIRMRQDHYDRSVQLGFQSRRAYG
jgi:hypothetical protein